MRRIAIGFVLLAACGDDAGTTPDAAPPVIDMGPPDGITGYVPGGPTPISHMDPGQDEDPAVLRAMDGSIHVAWFSEAAGNNILISKTTDGVSWSQPTHVSASIGKNFGPALYQDGAGMFHAVWFRWPNGSPPGKIVHAKSADGIAWTSEVDVTTATATDDWVPTLGANAAGDLLVAFARNTCPPPNTCYGISLARSTNGGTSWETPTTVQAAGAGLEHHLPALANTGSELVIAWDPYNDAANAPWDNAMTGAHISVIRSATGATWQSASTITTAQASAVTLYPTLYTDHAGAWHLAWMAATNAAQQIVEVPLASPAATPATIPLAGYSPRVVATPTPGVYLGAYVAGPTTDREVYVQVFAH